jgi:hypothetical protein
MRRISSSTGRVVRFLMFRVVKTKKETQFKYMETMELQLKDGELSILTRQRVLKSKDLTKTSVSM